MTPGTPTTSQDPRTILRVFWRWKVLFLVVLVIPPVLAYVLQHDKPKSYQSSTIVSLQSAPAALGQSAAQQNVVVVARLVTTTGYARVAATFLKPTASPGALLGAVTASSNVDTGFITITAVDPVPERAAAIANAFARALSVTQQKSVFASITSQLMTLRRQRAALPPRDPQRLQLTQQIAQLLGQRSQGQGINVIEPAAPSYTPLGTGVRRDVEIGVVIGLLLAIGLVLAAENSDRRLRNPDDVEMFTGMPVLGTIPRAAFSPQRKNADRTDEAFQMLRASLAYFNVDERLSSVMVVSAGAGEGKTTVAVGLARAAALAGRRVILVDTDLRRPQAATRLGLGGVVGGLGPVLAGEASLEASLVDVPIDAPKAGSLQVLPAGPPAPNPTALLGSSQMRLVIKQLEAQADLVIVDTAAALAVSDSLALLQLTSGAVVVVRMNQSSRGAVQRVQKMIIAGHGQILGAVATATGSGESYGYGYGYERDDAGLGSPSRLRSFRHRRRARPARPEAPTPAPPAAPSPAPASAEHDPGAQDADVTVPDASVSRPAPGL